MLDAIAHGILQAMTTLHKGSLPLPPPKGGGIELEGCWFLDTIEGGCQVVGDVIEIRIFRGEWIMGTVLLIRRR
jgi:hypothetical protein